MSVITAAIAENIAATTAAARQTRDLSELLLPSLILLIPPLVKYNVPPLLATPLLCLMKKGTSHRFAI